MMGDRIAAAGVADGLDAGNHIAHLAGTQLFLGHAHDLKQTDLFHLVRGVVIHEMDPVPRADGAMFDAEMNDGAPERIVMGIENQRLKRGFGVARGRWQLIDHSLHDFLDAQALLGRGKDGRFRIQAQIFLNLVLDPFDIRRRQINLVDHRNDFQIVLKRQVEIGQGLRLHALAGVDEQQGAFAGCQGPGYLIGEIHMARRVDQIQRIGLAVFGLVWQTHGLAFDGDAALAFDVHAVQDLILEVPLGNDFTGLDQPVGQGRLAVINVGDYAEVTYVFHIIEALAKPGINCRLTPDFNVVIINCFIKIFINIRSFSNMSTSIRKRPGHKIKRFIWCPVFS